MGDVSDYAKLTDVITVSTAVAELKDGRTVMLMSHIIESDVIGRLHPTDR